MARHFSMPLPELRVYIQEHAGKKNPHQMMLETGVNVKTISAVASELQVSLANAAKVEKRERCMAFIRDHGEEYTAAQIAKLMDVPKTTVYCRAWQLGVQLKQADDKKRKARKVMEPVTKRKDLFNVDQFDNWLIGFTC